MTAAEVRLWGTKIGTVVFDDNIGYGSFEYESSFLSSGIEVSPLTMPLSDRVYVFPALARESFQGLPGMLADSLPDKFGNAVINSWLEGQGRSPSSMDPVERLCYTGTRGMGALEYYPVIGPKKDLKESLHVEELIRLASDILSSRESLHISAGDHAMQELIRVGISAGGARAKAIIAWNEETGDIRSGQVPTDEGYGYWIMKFDGIQGNGDKEGEDDPGYTRIEYAYYLMARHAGITMTESRLYQENGRYHFMTRRFDREPETGGKLHMLTLGGIAHFDYNDAGAYSYEQAARVMRQLKISNAQISQFYRRMVFNVLARNQDDHVKNISFLMDRRGTWMLAPAYDVTYAYNPNGFWTGTHQMTIHGKRKQITLEDLLASAKSMGLKRQRAEEIIEDVKASQKNWQMYAYEAMLEEKTAARIQEAFVTV